MSDSNSNRLEDAEIIDLMDDDDDDDVFENDADPDYPYFLSMFRARARLFDSEDGDGHFVHYDEDDEEDGGDVIIPAVTPPRVSQAAGPSQEAAVINSVENGNDGGGEGEFDRCGEVDGCPICMEAWTNDGDHRVCCLPCGHIYGLSCIKTWIQQHGRVGKCPQCKRKCTLKGIRVLYASRIGVIDEELQKKVRSLEAQCAALEKKLMEQNTVADMLAEYESRCKQDIEACVDAKFAELKSRLEQDIQAAVQRHLEARLKAAGLALPSNVITQQ